MEMQFLADGSNGGNWIGIVFYCNFFQEISKEIKILEENEKKFKGSNP